MRDPGVYTGSAQHCRRFNATNLATTLSRSERVFSRLSLRAIYYLSDFAVNGNEALSRALGMPVCFQIFFLVGITNYLIQTADPIRAFGCPSGARTQDTAVNSRMLIPTELRGNTGPSLLTLGPDMGRALKKLAKRMLMATRRGLEPLAFAVTGRRDTLLHQRAVCNYWWPGWDSNPQNLDFESSTYANSVTRPYVKSETRIDYRGATS